MSTSETKDKLMECMWCLELGNRENWANNFILVLAEVNFLS